MKLGDKLRSLRAVEGSLRGLGRSMTQQELAAAMQSEVRAIDAKVDSWLFAGAEQFTADPVLQRALLTIAEHEDSRRAILLLAEILRTPDLAERLGEVLHPGNHGNGGHKGNGHPPPSASLRN